MCVFDSQPYLLSSHRTFLKRVDTIELYGSVIPRGESLTLFLFSDNLSVSMLLLLFFFLYDALTKPTNILPLIAKLLFYHVGIGLSFAVDFCLLKIPLVTSFT